MHVKTVHNRRKNKGRALVQVEVYFSRTQRLYFSTGVKVVNAEWDPKKQQVHHNHPRAIALNVKIRETLNKIYEWEKKRIVAGLPLDPDNLKTFMKGQTEFLTLNEYIRHQLTKGPEFTALRHSTWKKHNSVLNGLDKFGRIYLNQLDQHILRSYQDYLLDRMQASTTGSVHRVIKKYVNRALRDGLLQNNPYNGFKVPRERTRLTYLTEHEIDKIRAYEGVLRLEKVRDLFLFQCLTGMSFQDMQDLKPTDIQGQESKFIEKNRLKSDVKPQQIPLFAEAVEIVEKYADQHYCFPKISNQRYNGYLKEIAAITGIEKNLTSHVARHSFATLLLAKGLPLESVSAILGHANIKTTAIYAKVNIAKIQADFKRLGIDKI